LVLAVPALLLLLAPARAPAQPQPPKEEFDYRRFFRKPTNAAEFWDAMKFELEVGRFDLAAQHLHAMLQKKPAPVELLQLYEKDRLSTFLRLRLVPRWSENKDKDLQARKDVESLIEQMTAAVRAHLSNPERLKTFINNLYETPEENAFARIELAKSGSFAIPALLEQLRFRPVEQRGVLVSALSEFGIDTVPPLLAALDIEDDALRGNIIDALRKRKDFILLKSKGTDPAPYLWPLAGPAQRSEAVRKKAQNALAVLFNVDTPTKLPLAKEALTAEAERYYEHRVRFADPRRVAIWRWDEKNKKLLEDTSFTASKAEEYFALRFTRQALDIDPRYEPAQVLRLSLLLDKGYAPGTAEKPLGALKPTLVELLSTINPDLIVAVLERALRDERTPVILATVRALGNLADVRALQGVARGEPALVRALHYGDRRVQMAAVESILRIPGAASTQVTARIVEILKNALIPDAAASDRPRILVALADEGLRNDVSEAIKATGGDPVLASTGRDALRRLKARADIDVVLLDSSLPNPGLAFTLAQLRADRDVRRLPVLLAAIPDSKDSRYLIDRIRTLRQQIDVLDSTLRPRLEARLRQLERYGATALGLKEDPVLADQRRRKKELEERLRILTDRYEEDTVKREDDLRRFVERYRNIWVVSPNQLTDSRQLQARLEERLLEAGMPPLTKTERKEYAEGALRWLARMAAGELRGFDPRPAGDAVMNVLVGPPLSNEALLDALRITGTLASPKAQQTLITVLLDARRPVPVRVVAAEVLQRHLQKFGRPDPQQEKVLRAGLAASLAQPGLDPVLRDRVARLVGTLRPDDRTTGQRLRDFTP
jgi:CheY-like chemotaxis protein